MFLYYLPARQHISRRELASLGFGYLEGTSPSCRGCTRGPDGAAGVVFVAVPDGRSFDGEIGYFPKRQTWRNCKSFWLGTWNDAPPPAPSDLARDWLMAGHLVKMADGHHWQVPAALTVPRMVMLPQRLGLSLDGVMTADVMPAYLKVLEDADQIFDALLATGRFSFSIEDAVAIAARSLSVNYRVSRWECLALGLFTQQSLPDALAAIVDGPTRLKMMEPAPEDETEKKTADV